MKKLFSLILAIVMMASLLMVSTSAAYGDVMTANTFTVGASGVEAAIQNAEFIKNAVNSSSNTAYLSQLKTANDVVFGSNGGTISFYVDLATLFDGFNATSENNIPADYITATLTEGYSIASMNYSVVNLGTALAPKPALLISLTATSGFVSASALSATVTITHYEWEQTSSYAGNYKTSPLNVTVAYDVSDKATLIPYSNYQSNTYSLATCGNILSEELINAVKANKQQLVWNDAKTVGGLYSVALSFAKLENLTSCNLGAIVSNAYDGIDAPRGTIKVVDFLADHALADNATVSVVLDADFINTSGKEYNVYFIEEVEGSSVTVKGAKATFVEKAVFGYDAVGQPIASFNLLNNKLGTYILTPNTLTSDEVVDEAKPEVPNVNTGASNTVVAVIALAVLSLCTAGFVAIKKVK